MATPFGTVASAMNAATDGDIIALAKGTFTEEVNLRNGVTLWGACVAETVLTSSIAELGAGVVQVFPREFGDRDDAAVAICRSPAIAPV